MADDPDEYDTADLNALLDELPGRLAGVGVAMSPVMYSSLRERDMLFVHPIARIDDVLELLRITQPRVAWVEAEYFEPESLIEEGDRELSGVHHVLSKARAHDQDVFRLGVTWVADGLVSTWFATAGWFDSLAEEADIAVEAARGVDEIDRDLRQQQLLEQYDRWKIAVLADSGFRAATVNKRSTVVRALLTASEEVIEDPWLERNLLKEVRQEAAVEVTRQEAILEGQIDDLAERMVSSELWANVRTLGQQKAAIARFVVGVSDGWMLSEPFLDRLRAAALSAAARRRRS